MIIYTERRLACGYTGYDEEFCPVYRTPGVVCEICTICSY